MAAATSMIGPFAVTERIRLCGCLIVFCGIISLSPFATRCRAAEIVYRDGRIIAAKTLSKNRTHLTVERLINGKKVREEIELSKIHKVTINGKTHVLNKLDVASDSDSPATVRTRQQIQELIEQQGRTPPDWFDDTALQFPETLDLSWPMPAPKPWNNKKNIGQFIWDVINPNANKWNEGIRFMHHLLQLKQDEPATRRRVMSSLGSMYFRFHQDYARAAFWWEKAGVKKGDADSLGLAECYWRLGNKAMARQFIDNRRVQVGTIKLLGDMGETKNAVRIAELYAKQAREPQWALLAAGDAYRQAHQYKKAIEFYQRALDSKAMRNESYDRRLSDRANQNIEAIELFEFSDPTQVADGSYEAESMGYEGPIAVKVRVLDGRIEAVEITRHKEKQYYSAMRDIPEQIIRKQSVKEIDATSRATITADAIVHASAKALATAR